MGLLLLSYPLVTIKASNIKTGEEGKGESIIVKSHRDVIIHQRVSFKLDSKADWFSNLYLACHYIYLETELETLLLFHSPCLMQCKCDLADFCRWKLIWAYLILKVTSSTDVTCCVPGEAPCTQAVLVGCHLSAFGQTRQHKELWPCLPQRPRGLSSNWAMRKYWKKEPQIFRVLWTSGSPWWSVSAAVWKSHWYIEGGLKLWLS